MTPAKRLAADAAAIRRASFRFDDAPNEMDSEFAEHIEAIEDPAQTYAEVIHRLWLSDLVDHDEWSAGDDGPAAQRSKLLGFLDQLEETLGEFEHIAELRQAIEDIDRGVLPPLFKPDRSAPVLRLVTAL